MTDDELNKWLHEKVMGDAVSRVEAVLIRKCPTDLMDAMNAGARSVCK